MVGTSMTPAQAAQAAQLIAALRGLYGDLGDALEDRDRRRDIWAQIVTIHGQLAALMRGETPGAGD